MQQDICGCLFSPKKGIIIFAFRVIDEFEILIRDNDLIIRVQYFQWEEIFHIGLYMVL